MLFLKSYTITAIVIIAFFVGYSFTGCERATEILPQATGVEVLRGEIAEIEYIVDGDIAYIVITLTTPNWVIQCKMSARTETKHLRLGHIIRVEGYPRPGVPNWWDDCEIIGATP